MQPKRNVSMGKATTTDATPVHVRTEKLFVLSCFVADPTERKNNLNQLPKIFGKNQNIFGKIQDDIREFDYN